MLGFAITFRVVAAERLLAIVGENEVKRRQFGQLLAGTGSLLATPDIVRAQGQSAGIALVIGNSKYRWEAPLPNVRRDVTDVAKRFQSLGLKTELLQDIGRDEMRAAIDKFASVAQGANLAAFYFAGHGASWDKDTYLVPVDADLGNPETVKSLLPVPAISAALKGAAHRLLVFDNCRNNPADGWRQREALFSSSVARTELAAAALHGPDTLVLFSTAPGRTAVDGAAGDHSPFAAALMRQLSGQSVDLQTLAGNLRRDLLIATGGRQVLWDQNSYERPFVLTPVNRQAAVSPAPNTPFQIVELPKAYAFAREQQLFLPLGLVSLRSPADSFNSPKIGSFKTTTRMQLGQNYDSLYTAIAPLILIVVSMSGEDTAQVIVAGKDWWSSTMGGAAGPVWRYTTGAVSGSTMQFTFGRTFGVEMLRTFNWNDANSGKHSAKQFTGTGYSSSFTRLDG